MSVSKAIPERGASRFFYELREGWRKQVNVVFALLFRDLKTRSKDEDYGLLSIVGIVIEPAISVMALAAFWYVLRRQEIMGIHVFLFVAVSMTAYSIVRRSMASVPRTMRSSKAFYAYPTVKPIDAVLARFILEASLTIVGGTLVFLFGWWFLGLTISTEQPLEALGIILMLLVATFGISLFLAVYGMKYPFILKVMPPLTRLLFITSAVIHPAMEIPAQGQWYLSWNPFAHALELLRYYTLRIPAFPMVSFQYFASFCFVSLFIGLIAYYANRTSVIER